MPEESLVSLRLRVMKEWRKYYENPLKYVKAIKDIVKKADPEARVMIFGSLIKEGLRPDSDIDVLIITKLAANTQNRLKLRTTIANAIGDSTPLEIHIITPEEYENWYAKTLDKHIEIS